MRPVSSRFLAALRGSHSPVTRVVLCDPPGQTGVTPTGRVLSVVDGTVSLDGDADVRGTLDLTLAERFGDPAAEDVDQELLPYGAELFVTRGIDLGNGTVERCPLGYFRIVSVEQNEAPTGTLRITAMDRMRGIQEDRPTYPLVATGATTYGAALAAVVGETYPGATVDWVDGGDLDALGRQIVSTDDRLDFLQTIVESTGRIAYWDHRGHLVVKFAPDPDTPVWDVDAGSNGVLVSVARSVTREGCYNVVVARGQGADQTLPVQAVAMDLDPASPTYVFGPFGRIPKFFESNLILTELQALSTAQRMLDNSNGVPFAVNFGSVPNPALEPYDPVRVVYPLDLAGTPHVRRETHVVSKLAIPLGFGAPMTAETRMVQL